MSKDMSCGVVPAMAMREANEATPERWYERNGIATVCATLGAGVFERYPNIIDAAYDTLIKERPHTGGNLESFAIALDAILLSDNYESAVTRAINATSIYGTWASDSDTYGAIAGALAGAAYGASSIPEKWTRPLDPEKPTLS